MLLIHFQLLNLLSSSSSLRSRRSSSMFSRISNRIYTHFTSIPREECIIHGVLGATIFGGGTCYYNIKANKDFSDNNVEVMFRGTSGFIIGYTIPYTFPIIATSAVVWGINKGVKMVTKPKNTDD